MNNNNRHELLTASVGIVLDGDTYFLQIIFADSGRCLFRKISRDTASKLVAEEHLSIAQMMPEDIVEISGFKTIKP